MSEIISFRVDPDNPREAYAYKALQNWRSKGYSVRYVVTEALIKLGQPDSNLANSNGQELNNAIARLIQTLERLGELQLPVADIAAASIHTENRISESFIDSMRKTSKPGLRLTCSSAKESLKS